MLVFDVSPVITNTTTYPTSNDTQHPVYTLKYSKESRTNNACPLAKEVKSF